MLSCLKRDIHHTGWDWDPRGSGQSQSRSNQCPPTYQPSTLLLGQTRSWKVEVLTTNNQYWNSCCRVVSDHEVTFGSAIEPTKHSLMYFDHALYNGHLLHPKYGAPVVQMCLSTHLCFAQSWGLNLDFGGKTVAGRSTASPEQPTRPPKL